MLGFGSGLERPAAAAGSEAGPLGGSGRLEERDICRAGSPRRTRGPAVDAGGAHREDECAVESAVPSQDRLPARVGLLPLGHLVASLRTYATRVPGSIRFLLSSKEAPDGFETREEGPRRGLRRGGGLEVLAQQALQPVAVAAAERQARAAPQHDLVLAMEEWLQLLDAVHVDDGRAVDSDEVARVE